MTPKTTDLSKTALLCRVDELERELDRKTRDQETDLLTRLNNRIGLERRSTARKGWFVVCDLNGFKRAQDRHPDGHAHGDRILVEFAEHLQSISGPDDKLAARTGGDEFVVWVPCRAQAALVAHFVRCWRSQLSGVTAAAGIGWSMAEADKAMYEDKRRRIGAWARVRDVLTRVL